MQKKKQKVYVAMSGGVDSSVSAALLKRDGFPIVGVYMKCWTANDPLYKGCTSVDDERSARLVAAHLKIPFYTWNFIKEYKKKVVEYMLKGYKQGITPNPDIMCNREIKFGLFFDKAMKLGADYVATGHYARLRPAARDFGGQASIFQAKDKNKDQSYFLAFIKPEVLSRVVFPIGEYTKPQVRELARKFGLPNAERKESQGVCFIGKLDFEDFLKQHIKSSPGDIVNISGKVLGKHEGLVLYTIGQRKGIKLSGGPYYVVRKDFKRNQLFVSKNENDLFSKRALVSNINWFVAAPKKKEWNVEAKIRYRTLSTPVKIVQQNKNTYQLLFQRGQRAITPGQFAAFYKGEQLLGGGVIS